jgi:hypothetical protein
VARGIGMHCSGASAVMVRWWMLLLPWGRSAAQSQTDREMRVMKTNLLLLLLLGCICICICMHARSCMCVCFGATIPMQRLAKAAASTCMHCMHACVPRRRRKLLASFFLSIHAIDHPTRGSIALRCHCIVAPACTTVSSPSSRSVAPFFSSFAASWPLVSKHYRSS